MSFALLPSELLSLVVSYLDRDDLKTLRLVNRDCSTPATRNLYQDIHVSPNSASFDRAHEVAARDYLRTHVKNLFYHYGMLGDFYSGFDQFKHEYFAIRNPGETRNPSEVTAEVIWCYSCWLEELEAQATFVCRDELEELHRLCTLLPYLESISTLLDEPGSFTEAENYISRRTGMVALEDEGHLRFAKLFAAAANKQLRKISARSIQWTDIGKMIEVQEGKASVRQKYDCLCRLQYLELGIYSTLNEQEDTITPEELFFVRCLDIVLGQAENLTVLKLDFDELPYESHSEMMLPISEAIFKHSWPQLKELKLEAICAYEDALCQFLFAHRQTLRKLCFGDLELISRAESEHPPSVLHLFQFIRDNLELKSCKITGNFTNRIDQAWYVETEHVQHACLRDQLEEYLCAGTGKDMVPAIECTDEQVEAKLQNGELIYPWIHNLKQEFERFVDESWYWCPELLNIDETAEFI